MTPRIHRLALLLVTLCAMPALGRAQEVALFQTDRPDLGEGAGASVVRGVSAGGSWTLGAGVSRRW